LTYCRDLNRIQYHRGPTDADEWQCPLIAIGWLEDGYEFTSGTIVAGVNKRLTQLRPQFMAAFPEFSFRGLHHCSLCKSGERALSESHVNLFIPGENVVYVAPGRIDHYIEAHGYCPPDAFVDALLRCPDPQTDEYRSMIDVANRHHRPPLYLEKWWLYRLDDNGNRFQMQWFGNQADAIRMAEWFAAKGHKQTYEVEQARDLWTGNS